MFVIILRSLVFLPTPFAERFNETLMPVLVTVTRKISKYLILSIYKVKSNSHLQLFQVSETRGRAYKRLSFINRKNRTSVLSKRIYHYPELECRDSLRLEPPKYVQSFDDTRLSGISFQLMYCYQRNPETCLRTIEL